MRHIYRLQLPLIIFSLCFHHWACSSDHDQEAFLKERPAETEGPYKVANTTIENVDPSRDRVLVTEIWYPSREEAEGGAEGAQADAQDAEGHDGEVRHGSRFRLRL